MGKMTGLRHFQAGSHSSRVRLCVCVGGGDGDRGGGGAQDTEVVFKVFLFFCGHLVAERTLKGRTTLLCVQWHGGTQLVAGGEEWGGGEGRERREEGGGRREEGGGRRRNSERGVVKEGRRGREGGR